MRNNSTAWLLSLALALTADPALGQLAITGRRTLVATPPRVTLGQVVTLSVRGAANGARYRFTARMTATPGDAAAHVSCGQILSIGSGSRVTWQPKSGTHRLTAYGPSGRETDTLTLTFVVAARPAMLATSQMPAQPSGVTVTLRTDDLGPGHVYQWLMQHGSVAGSGAGAQGIVYSQPWGAQTTSPLATYPTPISSSAPIKATVSIHRGDPCDIIATGAEGPNQ